MDKQHGEFIGVSNLHAAIVTEDTATSFVAEIPEYLAPAAEVSAESETETATQYYDNGPGSNYVSEGLTTITLTISGVSSEMAAKYLGKHYDSTTGRVLDTGDPKPPYVALSFAYDKGEDDFRYYQYLKGTFTGGAEEAASKSGSIDVKTYELTYTAIKTTHKWEVDGKMKSIKRIFADSTDDAFTGADTWFDAVQTPDSSSPPSAIALSTIVPADNATAVARNSTIVLTFNNKIASEIISLINGTSGDLVTFTKTWDATGKILTMTPSTNLAATTKFVVAVTGVKDIYGQTLDITTKDFTTAS